MMPGSQTVKIDLRSAEGYTWLDFEVEPLGDNLYRVIEIFSCLDLDPDGFERQLEKFGYQNVIELASCPDGAFEFKSVKVQGMWRRFDFLVSLEYAESKSCARLLKRVVAVGGVWVRDAGGCLCILLPPHSTWDPTEDVLGRWRFVAFLRQLFRDPRRQ